MIESSKGKGRPSNDKVEVSSEKLRSRGRDGGGRRQVCKRAQHRHVASLPLATTISSRAHHVTLRTHAERHDTCSYYFFISGEKHRMPIKGQGIGQRSSNACSED